MDVWGLIDRYTRDITSYRSCYIDPLKCSTWALTREWALARDTTVLTFCNVLHIWYIRAIPTY